MRWTWAMLPWLAAGCDTEAVEFLTCDDFVAPSCLDRALAAAQACVPTEPGTLGDDGVCTWPDGTRMEISSVARGQSPETYAIALTVERGGARCLSFSTRFEWRQSFVWSHDIAVRTDDMDFDYGFEDVDLTMVCDGVTSTGKLDELRCGRATLLDTTGSDAVETSSFDFALVYELRAPFRFRCVR